MTNRCLLFVFLLVLPFSGFPQSPSEKIKTILKEYGIEEAGLIIKNKYHQTILKINIGDFDFNKPIPIASSSKWISAAIALKVLKKHGISLDQKIYSYLPAKIAKQSSDRFKTITFRQLLSFQSGMKGFYACTFSAFPWMNSKKCSERIIKNVSFREKQGFEYNNLHMTVLGYILEKIEKKKWNKIFNDEFKKFYSIQNRKIKYYSKSKKKRGDDNPLVPGGLVLTSNQYLDFLRTLVQHGQFKRKFFLEKTMVKELTRDQFPSGLFPVYKTPYESSGDNPHYALGNWVEDKGINSSGGAFGFYPWIDIQNHYYGIYATEGDIREFKRSYKIIKKVRPIVHQLLKNKK